MCVAVSMGATAMMRTTGSFGWGMIACIDRFWLVAVVAVTIVIIIGGVGIGIIIMNSMVEMVVVGVKA